MLYIILATLNFIIIYFQLFSQPHMGNTICGYYSLDNYTIKFIKEVIHMADNNNFGVINEQGYPAGQFGFTPITEQERKKIEEDEKKKEEKKNNE